MGKLRGAFDAGVLSWSPSQSKTIEFLGWVYEQLCERQKIEVADTLLFRPITAMQGRPQFRPTLHQISVASKVLIEKLGREPTQLEVNAFLKRNPDVGWFPNTLTVTDRGPFANASHYQQKLNELTAHMTKEPNRSTHFEEWKQWLKDNNDELVKHMATAREYAESMLKR